MVVLLGASALILVEPLLPLGGNPTTKLRTRRDLGLGNQAQKDDLSQVFTFAVPAQMVALRARGQVVIRVACSALLPLDDVIQLPRTVMIMLEHQLVPTEMTVAMGLVKDSPQVCRLHFSLRITIPSRPRLAAVIESGGRRDFHVHRKESLWDGDLDADPVDVEDAVPDLDLGDAKRKRLCSIVSRFDDPIAGSVEIAPLSPRNVASLIGEPS